MELAAIYHRSTDQFCYPLNDDELIINIQTGYDVDHVFLYEETHIWQVSWAARKNGPASGWKSTIKNV